MNLLRTLGSLGLAATGMTALLAGVIAAYLLEHSYVSWLLGPLVLLCVNLLAALASNPRFRVQRGLLVFHVGLAFVLLLTVAGLLMRFQARVILAEGQRLSDAAITVVDAGPLYPGGLDDLEFTQGQIRLEYAPELRRSATRMTVDLGGPGGGARVLERDQNILLGGFRFSSTSNKGITTLLEWREEDGRATVGAINYPPYPQNDWQQQMDWMTPGGQLLDLRLDLPPVPERDSWVLTGESMAGALEVRVDGQLHRLEPGQPVALRGGILTFREFRLWMGYRVEYAPLVPWIIAAGLVCILGLALHFYGTLFQAGATMTKAEETR